MEITIIYPERPRNNNGFMQRMKIEVKSRKEAKQIIDTLLPMDEKLDITLSGGYGYNFWQETYKNYK